ncbi:MAG: hypothetical protein RL328_357 [Acidobacteriota bacterium]
MMFGLVAAAAVAQVSPDINPIPSRQFGHAKLTLDAQTTSANLLEGRELNSPTAIAFDTTASPPIVYVADSGNHRVLAWRNPASLTAGNQADRVIGQRDFFKAFPGGPGATGGGLTSAGLLLPNSLAVDSSGNLWVYDAGNNRILRFPRPMAQTSDFLTPDLVIGQKSISTGNQSNQGQSKPSEKTLSSNRGGAVVRAGITFDAQGNLWATDPLNNRVLRFPVGRLNTNEPAADLVLGQQAFDSESTNNTQNDVSVLNRPAALAFDARGGLYVTDLLARTVYYDNLSTGALAKRILGIQPLTGVRPPAPNDYTIGQVAAGNGIAQCVVTVGNVPFICDTPANRLIRYSSADAWPAATADNPSPQIQGAFGQASLLAGGINGGNGLGFPGPATLYIPGGAAVYNNTEIWIADTGNNRVIAVPLAAGTFNLTQGSRVLGQLGFDVNTMNLVDGRELFVYLSPEVHGSSLAIDRTSTPNRLYVADSLNNRILGFKDVRLVGTDVRTLLTQPADVIIGQADRYHTIANYPSGDPLIPSDRGLFAPQSVAVDAQGNLWVADSFNGRLLRFPSPFSQPAGQVQRADRVLGQANFTTTITDASSSTMAQPTGIVVFNNGDLAAADIAHNRILLFRKSGDFVNGQAARAVLGQANFSGTAVGTTAGGLNRPRGLAVDSSDRLYVADTGNNRIIVYSSTSTIGNGATGTSIPNVPSPEGVAVSPSTGEVWISSFSSNSILRFREFTQLGANPTATSGVLAAAPMGIVLDQFDNLIAVEASNRLSFYYARMVYRHAATYASGSNLIATLTPGMYTLAGRSGKDFDLTPASGSIPYPKTLGGIQVLVEGIPAPITSITNNVIYFLIPNNAPSSGNAEFLITKPASGEILAAGTYAMGPAAPGFFTANQGGTRQIAATNQDGTPNSATAPIGQDQLLTLWLTGYGHLDNAPPDGEPAGKAVDTDVKPVINIGGTYTVPNDKILYSGLSPQYPGLWQINIRMPKNGEVGAPAPGNTIPIIIRMRDVPSNIGGTSSMGTDQLLQVTNGLITTIAFK